MSWIMEKIYALFRMNILIFVLLAATVIALFAYQNGLNDIKFLNLADYPYLIAQTDSTDGGSSAIKLMRTDSSVVVDYELKEGYPYPYAGVKILLGDGKTKGWDLSHYDSIFVWVKPRGEGTVRLYMRSYDAAFYREGDEASLKFNEVEFFPLEETYPAVFVPQEFRVASWWVAQNEINVHKARVDMSNVPLIEIQTGTSAPLGYGTMEIKGLCLITAANVLPTRRNVKNWKRTSAPWKLKRANTKSLARKIPLRVASTVPALVACFCVNRKTW